MRDGYAVDSGGVFLDRNVFLLRIDRQTGERQGGLLEIVAVVEVHLQFPFEQRPDLRLACQPGDLVDEHGADPAARSPARIPE